MCLSWYLYTSENVPPPTAVWLVSSSSVVRSTHEYATSIDGREDASERISDCGEDPFDCDMVLVCWQTFSGSCQCSSWCLAVRNRYDIVTHRKCV